MSENEKAPDGRELEHLTENELYCIAKHIQIHVVKGIFHNESEYRERFAPCETCKHQGEELPCKFKGYPKQVFDKLGKVTNTPIASSMRGFDYDKVCAFNDENIELLAEKVALHISAKLMDCFSQSPRDKEQLP